LLLMQKSLQARAHSYAPRPSWRLNAWVPAVVGIGLLLAVPILVVLAAIVVPAGEIWSHLASTVLPRYIQNSLLLMLGVGLGVSSIGIGTAWLVTMCHFPGRRLLEWALLLPMAIPAYILAYTYTDFLQFSGPLQSSLRAFFGWGARDYWFPEVRSLAGTIALLTLSLYPYVYLLARSAFLEQSLPLARPAIMAGVALALMETLSDFGTVDYFGIQTFTTGIYRTWFGLGERLAAVQLAAWLLMFVLVLIVLERFSRRRWQHPVRMQRRQSLVSYSLKGWRALLASFLTLLPLLLGFVLPAALLVEMTLSTKQASYPHLWNYARNSLLLSLLASLLAIILALVLAYGVRMRPNWLTRTASQLASLGYAVPGTVIAVSTLLSLGWLDQKLNDFSQRFSGVSTGLVLSGTVFALLYAYLVRFLGAAFNALEAGLKHITPSMDETAKSLGYRSLHSLFKVHVPLLRGSLLTGLLLVFVEVMKELPATLIIRPFNLDTLAIRVYRLASDERLREAAGGALAIVVVGILPVILLSTAIARTRERR
jgi:iron(III) transport system permease protein